VHALGFLALHGIAPSAALLSLLKVNKAGELPRHSLLRKTGAKGLGSPPENGNPGSWKSFWGKW
jgi:hypothetical protein